MNFKKYPIICYSAFIILSLLISNGFSIITGIVTNDKGSPVVDAYIRFNDASDSTKIWIDTTDAQGRYSIDAVVPIIRANEAVQGFGLYNSPNPVQKFTRINYQMDKTQKIELSIYDIYGQEVIQLFKGLKSSGNHSHIWERNNIQNMIVPQGIYFVLLKTEKITYSKSLLVISNSQSEPHSINHFEDGHNSKQEFNSGLSKYAKQPKDFIVTIYGKGVYPYSQPITVEGNTQDFQLDSVGLWENNRIILRDDYSNSKMEFEQNNRGRVAFLGGSITYNGGWRDTVEQFLQRTYPQTTFDFIRVGIPSAGALMHTFRYNTDVLQKGKVDLLFFESAVNDTSNGRSPLERIRATEGVIRQAILDNPEIDIVHMHFAQDYFYPYVVNDQPIPSVVTYEHSGIHYGVSMINLARYVAENYTWQQFGANVHPGPLGSSIYGNAIKSLLNTAWNNSNPVVGGKEKHFLHPDPFDPYSFYRGRFINIDDAQLVNGWTKVASWRPIQGGTRAGFVNIPALEATTPGSKLTLNFTGTAIGVIIPAGYDVGILDWTIDGSIIGSVDQYTRWSANLHLPWTLVFESELSNGNHTLELTISSNKNAQSQGNACRIFRFVGN